MNLFRISLELDRNGKNEISAHVMSKIGRNLTPAEMDSIKGFAQEIQKILDIGTQRLEASENPKLPAAPVDPEPEVDPETLPELKPEPYVDPDTLPQFISE